MFKDYIRMGLGYKIWDKKLKWIMLNLLETLLELKRQSIKNLSRKNNIDLWSYEDVSKLIKEYLKSNK